MRQQIQQSKILIAELVAKLQEEQAKLDRMEARAEKYEEAIAFLQEAIAEDPLLWGDVRNRLTPSEQIFDAEADSQEVEQEVEAIALPPTIIWNGKGVARLGCAKQKLAKDWAELLTLWGCATSVVKVECFSEKEIKWEVAILGITRSQLETLAKAHTSPHAEVPTRAGSKATEGDRVDADNDDEVSATQEDGGAIQVKKLESVKNDQAMSAVLDVASNILDTYWELDTDWLDNSDFEDYPRALVSKAFDWLLDKGFVTFDEKIGWQLTQKYCCFNLDDIVTFDYEKAVKDFEKYKAQAAIVDRESSDGEADIERDRLQSPSPDQVSDHPINSATVEEVLGGASPLSLKDEQLDELERALIAAPSIDDIADDKPSAYEERSFGDREADISKYDLALEILRYCYDIDAATASLCNFEYPEEIVEEALSWLSDKGYVEFNGNDWELKTEYYYGEPSPELAIAIRDFEEIHGEEFALLGKNEDEAICCVAYQILAYHFKNKKLKSGVDCFISRFPRNLIEEAYLWLQEKRCIKYPSSFEGARLIEPYCEEGKVSLALEELLNNFDRLSVTLDDVLDGASPLNLSDEQIDKLEQALVGEPTPSIEDFVDDKPSAYAEQMAQKIKPGSKLRSLSFPADPKHKSSRKRTGVVRRLEREGAYIYAFVSELTETGKDSRHTAFYNLEAVEIVEEAPAIDIAFDRFEPFDPTEDALGVVEAEILQFLKEKSAQADLYQDNQPDAPFSEILAATKLEGADRELALDALEKMEAKGLVSFDGDRWQIASEKPAQKEHSFKVGDRVTISGDSKGADLIGKTGTLTAVSLTGCVLSLDGEAESSRLFFCKEDLTPCSAFSQAA